MVIYGIDEAAAFAMLREASNRSNLAVRDLAYSLVHLFELTAAQVARLPSGYQKSYFNVTLSKESGNGSTAHVAHGGLYK